MKPTPKAASMTTTTATETETETETEKLYWSDPHLDSFAATTRVSIAEHGGKTSLVLDRTLFYPEGGGQLGDMGTLAMGTHRIAIADTQIDDAGTIHHVVADPLNEEVRAALGSLSSETAQIKGVIDAKRRRDHMTQHTAQHALSRALADVARAETVSARLGLTSCTIDVARPGIPDADLHKAEDLVNALIASDVDVRSFYPAAEELSKLPLRKQPKVTGGAVIRIIDIDGFDMTPCGGTHCTRTGQIGQARIVGLEKYKGMLRITFHAGLRALADARAKHDALAAIAADLTCGVLDVPGAVTKLRANLKDTRTQLDAARTELADLVARATLDRLPSSSSQTSIAVVVPLLRANDDVGALRVLAGKLATHPHVVALAGGIDPASGELIVVVQRGAEAKLDCGAFIQAQAKALSGRGGGRPERAEGRFPRGTTLDALATAASATL
jgi:alanyl-tRNA synthetase